MQLHLQIPDIVTHSFTIASLIVQKVKGQGMLYYTFQATCGSCSVSISVCLLSAVLTALVLCKYGDPHWT